MCTCKGFGASGHGRMRSSDRHTWWSVPAGPSKKAVPSGALTAASEPCATSNPDSHSSEGPFLSAGSDVVAMTTGTSEVSVDAPVDQHCKQKVSKVCGGGACRVLLVAHGTGTCWSVGSWLPHVYGCTAVLAAAGSHAVVREGRGRDPLRGEQQCVSV